MILHKLLLLTLCISMVSVGPAFAQDATVSQLVVPNGEIVSIAPDGRWLLAQLPLPPEGGDVGSLRAFQSDDDDESGDEPDPNEPKLCVYAFDSLVLRACTATDVFEDGPGRISGEVSWAPDGNAVVFSEGAVTTGRDGDLWRLDAASGALTNLTDDGFAGDLPFGEQTDTPVYFDTQPAFSPDGATIAFVRSGRTADEPFVTGVALLDVDSGAVTTLPTLPVEPIHTITGNLAWAPDGSRIWFTTAGIDETTIGLWSVARDGSALEMITAPVTDRDDEIFLLEVSPAGDLALVAFPRAMNMFRPPFFGLIELTTGNRIQLQSSLGPETDMVHDATFQADNRLVLMERMFGDGDDDDDVRLVAHEPGFPHVDLLAQGLPKAVINPSQPGLTLLPDGRIAYPSPREDDVIPWTVVSFDGQTPATPQPGSSFAPGATVVTTVETPLRATPAADGVTALKLPAGTEVVIIDAPVEVDGIVWWPVREPESGALGYIPQAYLTPRDG